MPKNNENRGFPCATIIFFNLVTPGINKKHKLLSTLVRDFLVNWII